MEGVLLIALAAFLVGFGKTSLGGLVTISVVIFAAILPARESTGALLPILIVGDLFACWHYRRDADWGVVKQLLPAVLPGLVLGSAFLHVVDDTILRRSIGGIILALLLLQLYLRSRPDAPTTLEPGMPGRRQHPVAAWSAGAGVGFTTMAANAAGAVMVLFLSASGIDKRRFVGTNAWFFLIVNLVKVPFSAGLGLLSVADLTRALAYAPAVAVGAWLGNRLIGRLSEQRFGTLILLVTAASAVVLIAR